MLKTWYVQRAKCLEGLNEDQLQMLKAEVSRHSQFPPLKDEVQTAHMLKSFETLPGISALLLLKSWHHFPQIREKRADLHEVIDRAVAARGVNFSNSMRLINGMDGITSSTTSALAAGNSLAEPEIVLPAKITSNDSALRLEISSESPCAVFAQIGF